MSGFTLASKAEYLLEVKQSRFLANGFPISGVEEAMALLDVVRQQPATIIAGHTESAIIIAFPTMANLPEPPASPSCLPLMASNLMLSS